MYLSYLRPMLRSHRHRHRARIHQSDDAARHMWIGRCMCLGAHVDGYASNGQETVRLAKLLSSLRGIWTETPRPRFMSQRRALYR